MDKKICVYAICKNEIKFIDKWFSSVKEADYICVLDTGSTDGSFEKLKSLGIITEQKIYSNFRFDLARNESLTLIPDDTDICVCVDLDEQFESGWAKKLKQAWQSSTTRARYRYTWNFNPDGSEGVVFMAEKIHKNKLYKWINPVHEILEINDNFTEKYINIPQIQLNHHADNSKSRNSYLPLLELSVKENPKNDRNLHYLGREYMFYKEYDKAIKTLKKHLSLPNAIWAEERCASLRYIANCYKFKNNFKKQKEYLKLAILECPNSREAYYELALFYYSKNNFLDCALILEQMLKITKRELNYISSPLCWDGSCYDYLSFCYYKLGNIKKAISNSEIALSYKNDIRIKNNLNFYKNYLKNQ